MKTYRCRLTEEGSRQAEALSQQSKLSLPVSEALVGRGIKDMEDLKNFYHPKDFDYSSVPYTKYKDFFADTVKKIRGKDNFSNYSVCIMGPLSIDNYFACGIFSKEFKFNFSKINMKLQDILPPPDLLEKMIQRASMESGFRFSLFIVFDDVDFSPDFIKNLNECGAQVLSINKCFQEDYRETHSHSFLMTILLHEILEKNVLSNYSDFIAISTIANRNPLVNDNRAICQVGLNKIATQASPFFCGLLHNEKQHINIQKMSSNLVFLYAKPVLEIFLSIYSKKIQPEYIFDTCVSQDIVAALQHSEELLIQYEQKASETIKSLIDSPSALLKENISLFHYKGLDSNIFFLTLLSTQLLLSRKVPALVYCDIPQKPNFYVISQFTENQKVRSLFENMLKSGTLKKYTVQGNIVKAIVPSKMFETFSETIEQYSSDIGEHDALEYDSEISFSQITLDCGFQNLIFEPTGAGNPHPRFLTKGVKIVQTNSLSRDGSVCLVKDPSSKAQFLVLFKDCEIPEKGMTVDLIYHISIVPYQSNSKGSKPQNVVLLRADDLKTNEPDWVKSSTQFQQLYIPTKDFDSNSRKLTQFKKAKIKNTLQLLEYLPNKYLDYTHMGQVSTIEKLVKAENGEHVNGALSGVVQNVKECKGGAVQVYCNDAHGKLFKAMFFNQPFIKSQIFAGNLLAFAGSISWDAEYSKCYCVFVKKWGEQDDVLRIVPFYKKIQGMSDTYFEDTLSRELENFPDIDYLEESVAKQYNLPSEKYRFTYCHFPRTNMQRKVSERRRIFDRLFRFCFYSYENFKESNVKTHYPFKTQETLGKIIASLPYKLTDDQETTIKSIISTAQAEKRINALIQGDVGCGKTIIAACIMATAAENGYQSCIIVPTEILAKQHFETLSNIFSCLPELNIVLLTGKMKATEKRKALEVISDGQANIIVGTHSLLQESVEYSNLGLVVIDEQHKFGVEQRNALLNRENIPHMITMSATPIPRTLSIALYGNAVTVYNVKSRPNGRLPVITIPTGKDEDSYEIIANQVKMGHQCYIVCPAIDSDDRASVENEMISISNYYKGKGYNINIASLYSTSKMDKEQAQQAIDGFQQGQIDVLISTVVIEVGVNNPNATVVLIKNADNFGLAQAHQLRGRVGRGSFQSYCVLQTDKPDNERVKILCETTDGFKIAEEDMRLRGVGDVAGTQQSGANEDVLLISRNRDLYSKICITVADIYKDSQRKEYYLKTLQKIDRYEQNQ